MNKPAIRVHIEELVLHGFPPNDRYAIATAVQRELSSLFEVNTEAADASTLLAVSSAFSRIDAGSFQVHHGEKAASIGVQIANAVYGGLTK